VWCNLRNRQTVGRGFGIVTFLDRWWTKVVENRRFDHGFMYVCIMIVLFCLGLSMSILGPVPGSTISSLSEGAQNFLASMLTLGSLIAIVGIFSGSRFFFPTWSRRRTYRFGIASAPIICACLIFYSIAIFSGTPNWPSALGGVFAPLACVGVGLNAISFGLEIRRIARNADKIDAIRNHIDIHDDLSADE